MSTGGIRDNFVQNSGNFCDEKKSTNLLEYEGHREPFWSHVSIGRILKQIIYSVAEWKKNKIIFWGGNL